MTRAPSRLMCPSVGAASTLLKVLANHNRLAIVCHLVEAPRSVGALENELGIPQPTLSLELATLRRAGIVQAAKAGRSVHYALTDARAVSVVLALRPHFAGLDAVVQGQSAGSTLDAMMFV